MAGRCKPKHSNFRFSLD